VPTVSPLGADGEVVSGRVVTMTRVTRRRPKLYIASNAVTLNVRVVKCLLRFVLDGSPVLSTHCSEVRFLPQRSPENDETVHPP
jgi:hypothetical protein